MIGWRGVKLAVFDVDGTLYDQKSMRLAMAAQLVMASALRGDLATPRILSAYRKMREDLAEAGTADFEAKLELSLAERFGRTPQSIRATVQEWMHRRPLPFLRRARYPGVDLLFDQLRRSGRSIAILSDYPATAKVQHLGLEADLVVAAGDEGVPCMKPNPAGLLRVMKAMGAEPAQTVMIGDRPERDGEIGAQAGVAAYIRSSKPIAGSTCFQSFHELLPVPAEA